MSKKPLIGTTRSVCIEPWGTSTGACHDLAIASYKGKGTGETNLFRQMYDTLKPGDVVLADALFDDYFISCELCHRTMQFMEMPELFTGGSMTERRSLFSAFRFGITLPLAPLPRLPTLCVQDIRILATTGRPTNSTRRDRPAPVEAFR